MTEYVRFRIFRGCRDLDLFREVEAGVVRIESNDLATIILDKAMEKISKSYSLGIFSLLELESSTTIAYYTFSPLTDAEIKPGKPTYISKRFPKTEDEKLEKEEQIREAEGNLEEIEKCIDDRLGVINSARTKYAWAKPGADLPALRWQVCRLIRLGRIFVNEQSKFDELKRGIQ